MTHKPPICPDCLQHPATHHDGSGWFCDECKRYVDTITRIIDQNIEERRAMPSAAKATRKRNWRAWYHKNKKRRTPYLNAYSKFYGRGLRGAGLRDAMAACGISMKPRTA